MSTMWSSRANDLPVEIKKIIASDLDKSTARALMATNKSLRVMGGLALEPFLFEESMIAKPSFVQDVFQPIDTSFANHYEVRRQALSKRSKQFEAYVTVYPPASSYIKRLTLELRDDDTEAGWTHLVRLGPQLEHLDVHFYDNLWRASEGDGWLAIGVYKTVKNTPRIWRRVLDLQAGVFTEFTSLSLSATARVLDQFLGLVPNTPNLRKLTLSCHWSDTHRRFPYTNALGPRLPYLQSLTVAGDAQNLVDVLDYLDPMQLHDLRLYLTSAPNRGLKDAGGTTELVSERRVKHLTLQGLPDVLLDEIRWTLQPSSALYGSLETLILDDMHLPKVGMCTFLLDEIVNLSPWLRSLKRLVLVGPTPTSLNLECPGIHGKDFLYLSRPMVLAKAFEMYPKLEQIEFTAAYPSDPFTSHPPATWPERKIRGCIFRSYENFGRTFKLIRFHTSVNERCAPSDPYRWHDRWVDGGDPLSEKQVWDMYGMEEGSGEWYTSQRRANMPRGWKSYKRLETATRSSIF